MLSNTAAFIQVPRRQKPSLKASVQLLGRNNKVLMTKVANKSCTGPVQSPGSQEAGVFIFIYECILTYNVATFFANPCLQTFTDLTKDWSCTSGTRKYASVPI